jgi:predicted Zn-dependent peptidase
MGTFQQLTQGDHYATVAVVLPINSSNPALQTLITNVLQNGSWQRKQQIESLDAQGIHLNIAPAYDKVYLIAHGKMGQETNLLNALGMLLGPLDIDPTQFRSDLKRMKEALVSANNTPGRAMNETITQQLVGEKHPYSVTLKQLVQQLSATTPAQLAEFYQQVVGHTEKAQLVMVSEASPAEQQALCNGWLNQHPNVWQPQPQLPFPVADIPEVKPNKNLGKPGSSRPVLVAEDNLDRLQVSQVWLGPTPNDPDFFTFKLMAAMLAGMTGPLFRILRTEEGLVYSTTEEFAPKPKASVFSIGVQVDYDKLTPALKGLEKAINTLIEQPPDPNDLERIKREALMEERLAQSHSFTLMSNHASRLGLGQQLEPVETVQQKLASITPQDIQRVAQRFLSPANINHVVGISGPAKVLQQYYPQVALLTPETLQLPPDAPTNSTASLPQGEWWQANRLPLPPIANPRNPDLPPLEPTGRKVAVSLPPQWQA